MSDQMLGRYRLLSLLATGGMGEVFLARQEGPAGFSKTVVVKRILRHLARDQGFIDQFVNEARLAALLQHPNIAQVFGLEHEAGTWFMAMEYVHGRSLRVLIEECRKLGLRVPLRIAVRLASQVLQGLHLAHELTDDDGKLLGILHRDVTPENILVSFAGDAKLVDFGIAKAMGAATLRQRAPWGKLPYMAPELILQIPPADRRADIYAAGVVLHELLMLEKPANIASAVATFNVPSTPYRPTGFLPQALDAILAKALAIDPRDRWSTGAEMSHALEGWLAATGQLLAPSDVRRFLVDVFGPLATERRDSGSTPIVNSGTAPLALGMSPVSPTARLPQQQAIIAGEPSGEMTLPDTTLIEIPDETSKTGVMVLLGIVTGLVFLAVIVAGIKSSAGHPPKMVDPQEAPLVVLPGAPEVLALAGAGAAAPSPVPDLDAGQPDEDELNALEPDAPVKPKWKEPAPKTGKVIFKVTPGVEVFLGARSLGLAPLKSIALPAGTVTFTLKNAKARLNRKVTVKVVAGGSVQLTAGLKK